jgi:hypothetical protein
LLPDLRRQVAGRLGARLVDPSVSVAGTVATVAARPVDVAGALGAATLATGTPLAAVPVLLGATASATWDFSSAPAGVSALTVTPASSSGVSGVPLEVDVVVTGGVGPRVVLPTGSLAQTADGAVWLIDDAPGAPGTQVRRPLASWAVPTFPGASGRLIPGADDSVLALPLGAPAPPREGTLLRSPSGYYVVSQHAVCPLSAVMLVQLGYPAGTALSVSDADLGAYPVGPAVSGPAHPAGSYVRADGQTFAIVASSTGASMRRAVVSATALATLVPASAVLAANGDDRALPLDRWRPGLADGVVWSGADGTVGVISRGVSRPVTAAALSGLRLGPPVDATPADLGTDGTPPVVGPIVDQRVAAASAVVTMVGDRLQHRASWAQIGYGTPDAPGPSSDPPRP